MLEKEILMGEITKHRYVTTVEITKPPFIVSKKEDRMAAAESSKKGLSDTLVEKK